jgi:hypothetical protein
MAASTIPKKNTMVPAFKYLSQSRRGHIIRHFTARMTENSSVLDPFTCMIMKLL